jgi:hypothetical protein
MLPESVSLRKFIKVLQSQETVQCCTASASLVAAEMIMNSAGLQMHFSRLYVYWMTRKLQNRLGKPGAELHQTLNALKIHGASPENLWPFSTIRIDREPHLPAIEAGVHYRIQSYRQTNPSEYKSYLTQNIPVIVGMHTGKRFWSLKGPLEEQVYMPVNLTDNRQSNGHAITIVGYDDRLRGGSWIIANSLGPCWGFQGYGAIPYECNRDIGESYVITKFAGIEAGKNISEI